MNEWISVNDSLPDEDCLTCVVFNGRAYVALYDTDNYFYIYDLRERISFYDDFQLLDIYCQPIGAITHWLKIPWPPTE